MALTGPPKIGSVQLPHAAYKRPLERSSEDESQYETMRSGRHVLAGEKRLGERFRLGFTALDKATFTALVTELKKPNFYFTPRTADTSKGEDPADEEEILVRCVSPIPEDKPLYRDTYAIEVELVATQLRGKDGTLISEGTGGSGGEGGAVTLGELSDVDLSSPSDGELLGYDGVAGTWKNVTIGDLGFVSQGRTISAGTGLTGGGDLSQDRTLAFDTGWGDDRYVQQGGGAGENLTIDDGNGAGVTLSAVEDTLVVNQQDGGGLGYAKAQEWRANDRLWAGMQVSPGGDEPLFSLLSSTSYGYVKFNNYWNGSFSQSVKDGPASMIRSNIKAGEAGYVDVLTTGAQTAGTDVGGLFDTQMRIAHQDRVQLFYDLQVNGTADAAIWDILLQEVQDIDPADRKDARIIYWDAGNSTHKYIDLSDLVSEKGTLRIGDVGLASSGHSTTSGSPRPTPDGDPNTPPESLDDGHVWIQLADTNGDGVREAFRSVWDADAGAWDDLTTGIAAGVLANDSIFTSLIESESLRVGDATINTANIDSLTAGIIQVVNDTRQSQVLITGDGINSPSVSTKVVEIINDDVNYPTTVIDGQKGILSGSITGGEIYSKTTITVGDPLQDRVLIHGGDTEIRSTNFIQGLGGAGFRMGLNRVDIGDLYARGTFYASVFQKGTVNVVEGELAVATRTRLSAGVAAGDNTFSVEDEIFQEGDRVYLKSPSQEETIVIKTVVPTPVKTLWYSTQSFLGWEDGWQTGSWPEQTSSGPSAQQSLSAYKPDWDTSAFGGYGGFAFDEDDHLILSHDPALAWDAGGIEGQITVESAITDNRVLLDKGPWQVRQEGGSYVLQVVDVSAAPVQRSTNMSPFDTSRYLQLSGGRLFIARDDGTDNDSLWVGDPLDPTTNTTLLPPDVTRRIVECQNTTYLIGWLTDPIDPRVYKYDFESEELVRLSDPSTWSTFTDSFVLNEVLHVRTGGSVHAYDATTDSWSDVAPDRVGQGFAGDWSDPPIWNGKAWFPQSTGGTPSGIIIGFDGTATTTSINYPTSVADAAETRVLAQHAGKLWALIYDSGPQLWSWDSSSWTQHSLPEAGITPEDLISYQGELIATSQSDAYQYDESADTWSGLGINEQQDMLTTGDGILVIDDRQDTNDYFYTWGESDQVSTAAADGAEVVSFYANDTTLAVRTQDKEWVTKAHSLTPNDNGRALFFGNGRSHTSGSPVVFGDLILNDTLLTDSERNQNLIYISHTYGLGFMDPGRDPVSSPIEIEGSFSYSWPAETLVLKGNGMILHHTSDSDGPYTATFGRMMTEQMRSGKLDGYQGLSGYGIALGSDFVWSDRQFTIADALIKSGNGNYIDLAGGSMQLGDAAISVEGGIVSLDGATIGGLNASVGRLQSTGMVIDTSRHVIGLSDGQGLDLALGDVDLASLPDVSDVTSLIDSPSFGQGWKSDWTIEADETYSDLFTYAEGEWGYHVELSDAINNDNPPVRYRVGQDRQEVINTDLQHHDAQEGYSEWITQVIDLSGNEGNEYSLEVDAIVQSDYPKNYGGAKIRVFVLDSTNNLSLATADAQLQQSKTTTRLTFTVPGSGTVRLGVQFYAKEGVTGKTLSPTEEQYTYYPTTCELTAVRLKTQAWHSAITPSGARWRDASNGDLMFLDAIEGSIQMWDRSSYAETPATGQVKWFAMNGKPHFRDDVGNVYELNKTQVN